MSLLVLRNAIIRIGGRALLDGADLTLDPGRHVGLVGRNGAGKSTLLAAIAGDIALDGGELRLARRIRLGRVAQTAPAGAASLIATVLAADIERSALLAEADHADPGRLAEIHDRLRAIGADAAPARAAAILAGLGFDAEAQARPVDSFSGGWRMRVALAAALFLEPDLLLLDEPTNHLDLEATLWLEGWLARFGGAALIVSHDRGLLNRAVDSIAHLENGRIATTPGGYDSFVRIRTERLAQRAAEAERIAATRAHMQEFVDRFRYKASKARQAQARLKAIARLPAIESVVADKAVHFDLPPPAALPAPLVRLEDVAVGYGGPPVLRWLSLRLDPGDRIALLGANGRGKSTFAKLLAGRLAPQTGTLWRAPKLAAGYFAQHQEDELDGAASPVTLMARALPQATPTAVRSQLARFGLDADRAETRVADLSGGERARLLLALATREAPPLLILDEPTNHLDLDARDALVRALADFPGAVVLITHEPDLVDLIADRLWLVGAGTVAPYAGDLDDYRRLLAAPRREPAAATAEVRREPRRERAGMRAATAPLMRTMQQAEKRIATLAAERARFEAALADPAVTARSSAATITAAHQRLAAIAREVAETEEAWLAAADALENADTVPAGG